MERKDTIYDLLIAYLNMAGVALMVSLLICGGLQLIFPQKKLFTKRMIFGQALILFGILFFIRKIPLFLQWL